MKSDVKKVIVKNGEGPHEHSDQLPKEFSSFEEVNIFLQNRAYLFSKGGYFKHDVEVYWENGESYGYRADLAHPEGSCFSSIEYNVGARVKCGLEHMSEDVHFSDKEKEELKRILETCKTSTLDTEYINNRDVEIRKKNKAIQEENHYNKEFEDLVSQTVGSYVRSHKMCSPNETVSVEGKSLTVLFKKGEYIRWTGFKKLTNKYSKEQKSVGFGDVYIVGQTAGVDRWDSGEIVNITAKNVIVQLECGKKKMMSHMAFVDRNRTDSNMTESERTEMAYYRAYAD